MATPNFIKFLEVITSQLDRVDDVFTYIKDNLGINEAEGVWLDRLHGRIVGLERPYREQPYGTIFAFKQAETDLDDPYKGFLSGGIGGYFQTLVGVKYLADPTERMDDDDYRDRILAKAIANHSSGIITDIWRYLTTGFGQTNPTIVSEPGTITVTIANDEIMRQRDRNLFTEQGPVAAGIGVIVDNWPLEYMPFTDNMNSVSTWAIDTDTVDSLETKVLHQTGAGDWCWVDMPDWSGLSTTEVAYGEWEFWFEKTAASAPKIIFIASEPERFNFGTQNGYYIHVGNNESIAIWRIDNGVKSLLMATAIDIVTIGVWHKITVTRSALGVFTTYLDDVAITAASGSNPATDTTHTTAQYCVWDPDLDDKLGLTVLDTDVPVTTWTPL